MSSSNIWISVNYISNWFTAVTTAFNVLWMLEMCINAIIQKKDLQDYIDASKDWKTPLVIMTVLAVVSAGIIYVTPLGIFAFVISLFALGFQIFFMTDYSRMLYHQIEDSWFLSSTYAGIGIIGLAIGSLLCLLITTLATTGLGL